MEWEDDPDSTIVVLPPERGVQFSLTEGHHPAVDSYKIIQWGWPLPQGRRVFRRCREGKSGHCERCSN